MSTSLHPATRLFLAKRRGGRWVRLVLLTIVAAIAWQVDVAGLIQGFENDIATTIGRVMP